MCDTILIKRGYFIMKKGFTIAELLITLGIVGVLAAMTAPVIMDMMPNDTKVRFMKAYNAIAVANDEMLDNSDLYKQTVYLTGSPDILGEPTCIGLGCVQQTTSMDPALNSATAYANSSKYAKILAYQFGIPLDDVTTSGSKSTFTAKDGSSWEITSTLSTENSAKILNSNIVVDIDGKDKGDNCNSSTSSCKKPDQFKFKVDTYGAVSADDTLGKQFLKNAADVNSNSEED